MMFQVIKRFTDLQDEGHKYAVGETYPREGLKPPKKRISELSGDNNRQGVPLIEKIEDEPPENDGGPPKDELPTDGKG